jgi:hypothetical protein
MKQLSIITENHLGVVTKITEALAKENINIESLDAELAGEQVIVVLNVDQYDKALHIIHQLDNMQIVTEDAILVRLINEPGALAKIARRFTNAGIGLRSIRFIQRDQHFGLVAICTDRTEQALQLVDDVLVS